jgi:hypothetical protein
VTEQENSSPAQGVAKYRMWLVIGGAIVIGLIGLWAFGRTTPPGEPPEKAANRGRAPAPAEKVEVELTEGQVKAVKIEAVGQASFDLVRQSIGNIDFNQNLLVQVFTPNQGSSPPTPMSATASCRARFSSPSTVPICFRRRRH